MYNHNVWPKFQFEYQKSESESENHCLEEIVLGSKETDKAGNRKVITPSQMDV